MKRSLFAAALLALSLSLVSAREIGYVEQFALSTDRTEALKQLVPGSEDYYYYTCLHYLNEGEFSKVDELLKPWIQRYNRTQRVVEIENRLALFIYDKDAKRSLEYLRSHLGLNFNHQQEQLNPKPNLPTALDQKLIGAEVLTQRALVIQNNLGGFEDAALDWVAEMKLSPERLRDFLRRIQRPDVANLVQLVLTDLQHPNSGGFGSLEIHNRLMLPQLEALLKEKPTLKNETKFVRAWLARLRPDNDSDWRNDAKEREAFLDRLWAYAQTLDPAHNSLKAHILYHRLAHDRALGKYDAARFMTYIQLPRNASYVNPKYLEQLESRNRIVNLGESYQEQTGMPPIGGDEELVRDYLMQIFPQEKNYDAYRPFMNDIYLKETFAECKILNGIGKAEEWTAMLPPEKYQAIKERVELDFLPANRMFWSPGETVALDLRVKNVDTLIIKVFEINTANYYREFQKEIDTDIPLDGLVANDEKVEKYKDGPFLRKTRHFEFDKLGSPTGRGLYVVEFIGNGKSSRALIRKGRLHFLEQAGAAGHTFTVLDENNNRVKDARLIVAAHEYTAGKDGDVVVPFSTRPARTPVILLQGGFASLDFFQHQGESYSLKTGFHVDRESLIKRRTATLAVRPSLLVNGMPATVRLLKETNLRIQATDQDGVGTTQEVNNFALFDDRESSHTFQVPERLASLSFVLMAKVQNVSLNKEENLQDSRTFAVNGLERTEKTETTHLTRLADGFVLDLLGRSGEPRANRPVQVVLKHRDFTEQVHVSLQSNDRGRVDLGALRDITSIEATGPEGPSRKWILPLISEHSYPSTVHGRAGQPLYIPYMGSSAKPQRSELSLLEMRGNSFLNDRFDAIAIESGFLKLDDLPSGDYDLLIKPSGARIQIRLAGKHGEMDAKIADAYVLAANRRLEMRNPSPLQIVAVIEKKDTIEALVSNAGPNTRVHVFATRYMPAWSPWAGLGRTPFAEPAFANVPKNRSLYLSGRDIGDEYRYILERKMAKKFPGVMFKRPELLLNPWELQKTETGEKMAQAGDEYAALRQAESTAGGRGATASKPRPGETFSDYASLDFLADSSTALLDLKPNANGVVIIERKALGNHPNLLVFAADPDNSVYRQVMLQTPAKDDAAAAIAAAPGAGPSRFPRVLDLRLAAGLEPDKHFTERKLIDTIGKGGVFTLSNVTTAKCEVYDNLERVFRLYATLSSDATLQEFRFILDWPTFKPEEKREKYEKYASHELHFFLYKKDPAFFKESVLPFLRNKKDKTFLDWLLIAAIDGNGKAPELSEWLKPWRHAQLNVVEKILLAQRLAADREGAARLVNEQFRLLPPDIDRYNHLFLTALQGRALEMAGGAGGGAFTLSGGVLANRRAMDGKDSATFFGADKVEMEVAATGLAAAPPLVVNAPMPAKSAAAAEEKPADAERYLKKAPARAAGAPARKMAGLKGEALAEMEQQKVGLKRDELRANFKARASNVDARKSLEELSDYSYADRAGKAMDARVKLQRLYRALEGTKEFAESNYYHMLIAQQIADRVTVNAFWNDYAKWDGKSPFISKNLAEASRNFTEMMFALSVLDLPFQAKKLESKIGESSLTIEPGNEAVIFHKEIGEAKPQAEGASLLVSQNFFRLSDRYREENGERYDKFITQEFLINVVYGCQIVATNPTSTRYKVDVLLEIPRGAIPVQNSQYTRSVHLDLQPYNTRTLEYHFYFPAPGKFMHYPVHVARNETLMAFVQPFNFNVVEQPSQIDKASWDYISQFGTEKDVLEFLGRENVQRTRLDRIAWRMKEASFFRKTLDLLQKVHAFDATLWSYGIKHNEVAAIREYLQFRDDFVQRCGAYIDSPLLKRDPVLRKTYQHLEYSPLVNPRIHQLGRKRDILNDRLFNQYHELMAILSCRPALDQDDLMTVTYYLLLQDRVEEAQKFFDRVKQSRIETDLQYDYFKVYLAFCAEDLKTARSLATKYADYPAERWRKLFAAVVAQLDEIEKGVKSAAVDKMDQTEEQTRLAAAEPTLEFKIEAQKIQIQYQNVTECEIRYYPMDIELLFSRQPFVQEFSGLFSSIRPNSAETIKLDAAQKTRTVDLPAKYQSSNVMVEIVAGALRKSQACYANSLNAQVAENYAQLKVAHAKTGKALSKVYIKVYARMQGGEVRFYKDGYTDPRGRFDYGSLNTNELDRVERFAILILSESDGALVKEAGLPKR